MALSHSPRKVVPLASGDDWPSRIRTNSSGPTITKRVFFCGVVVENAETGNQILPVVKDFIASLGEPLDLESDSDPLPAAYEATPEEVATGTRRRAMTNSSALADIVKEFITTERSYVKRLKTLKHDYADPLRTFARSKETAILPPYEAKTIFGNIDHLLPVNEAFLDDLEKIELPGGPGIGEVALRHFKELRGFENYKQYYSKREEAQVIFEREIKKSSGFAAFVDRIKYSSTDAKNRIGLRELLMEPVQRIPRYTLMFRIMMKHMAPNDPQRAALAEADEIASRIALAETDEQTKRAAVMYTLSASIEDFPPALVSHGRRFIDCIDVEDTLADLTLASQGTSQSSTNLHCTLFLFDDKLMIVRRPSDKGGRALTGLDDLEKVAKTGGLSFGRRKSGLSCKGVVDIVDLAATDVGGSDFHMYFEYPPHDQVDRWSGRPFRSFSVVQPPGLINLNPPQSQAEKQRFLENLWEVQARYRTKRGQSVILATEDQEVESRAGKVTVARTYFNVYQRTAFLQEHKKTKVVLQIDEPGSADPIPFGIHGPPFVVIKVQPMVGDLCRYRVISVAPGENEPDRIVKTEQVPKQVVETIHQFGLFKFRTGKHSVPSTPTASMRSRAGTFGLDAISRNLFNARPGSAMGDLFGGSTSGHRRSKTSTNSRSSIYTATSTHTGDSGISRFSRATTSTAATSLMDESMDGSLRSRGVATSKKLVKRSPLRTGSFSEPDTSPVRMEQRPKSALAYSMSASSDVFSDGETDPDEDEYQGVFQMDDSERDLAQRLALARQNSETQREQQFAMDGDEPIEEMMYEEDPPDALLSHSRLRDLPDIHLNTHGRRSITPRASSTRAVSEELSPTRHRQSHSPARNPRGSRTPSPLPPHSPQLDADRDLDAQREDPMRDMVTRSRARIPRSKRQPFDTAAGTEQIPGATFEETPPSRPPSVVEPLSIQKKSSVRSSDSVSPSKQPSGSQRNGPLKLAISIPSSNRASSPAHQPLQLARNRVLEDDVSDRMLSLAEATMEDLEFSRRALKRIRLETEKMRSSSPPPGPVDQLARPTSPVKTLRSSQSGVAPPPTKEAQARMEEMQRMIQKRRGEAPRIRHQSMSESSPPPFGGSPRPDYAKTIDNLVTDADSSLSRAMEHQDLLQSDVNALASRLQEKYMELERLKVDLRGSQRQCELLKSLLTDCTTEKEILFEAFNEELDKMYNDASLPDDEAWAAMTRDLRQAKVERNAASEENDRLKRRLAELEVQQEEWGTLLRSQGFIA